MRNQVPRPTPGLVFAYRERAKALGELVIPVEVVRLSPPRMQKVRVKYLGGPLEGLEEWVPNLRLLALWEDAERLIADEKAYLKLRQLIPEVIPRRLTEAIGIAFGIWTSCYGAEVFLTGWNADEGLVEITGLPDSLFALGTSVEAVLKDDGAFVDRFGVLWCTMDTGAKVAKLVCAHHPDEVVSEVGREFERLREELNSAGRMRAFWEEQLGVLTEACSLLSEWCAINVVTRVDQLALLTAEVARLRELVRHLAGWLKDAGHPVKARLALKEIGDEPKNLVGRTSRT